MQDLHHLTLCLSCLCWFMLVVFLFMLVYVDVVHACSEYCLKVNMA